MSNPNFQQFPQSSSITSLRFLSPISPFSRLVAAASITTTSFSVDLFSLSFPNPNDNSQPLTLSPLSSLPSPSPITSLSSPRMPSPRIPLAFSTLSGSLLFSFLDPLNLPADDSPIEAPGIHRGPVSAIDMAEGLGGECVSVGMDGRVNVVGVGEGGRVERRRVGDSKGLVGYGAVRWGSNVEFATGGLGFGVQWWDHRRAGGAVSQLKGNW